MDAKPSAVPTARHWVVDTCTSSSAEVDFGILELLTTEVVANAVLHGSGPVCIDLTCDNGCVRVAVADANPRPPVVKHVGTGATGGRGMALVDALADRWGSSSSPGNGKTVWFELEANGCQDALRVDGHEDTSSADGREDAS
ncbi:ATP-binding protein [Kineococcus xinjiangensis]|uniref:ATP-binding protein n=1 Tax=Kineococcus xinjiangensis TaxID=512762 RepID=UPI001FE9251F|nr:ATP-binding protein [Kineococcus xinjiangensis]